MKKKKLIALTIIGVMLLSACGKKEEITLDPSIQASQQSSQVDEQTEPVEETKETEDNVTPVA